MSEKVEKLVKKIRTELSEVLVADKKGSDVWARAILLHVRTIIDRELEKGNEHEENS